MFAELTARLTRGSNPLQFIGNERRERLLIAAQPRCDDCLIRRLDLIVERLSKSGRREERWRR